MLSKESNVAVYQEPKPKRVYLYMKEAMKRVKVEGPES